MSKKEIISLSRISFGKKGVKPKGKKLIYSHPAPSLKALQILETTFVFFVRSMDISDCLTF
jgi:hypothetical protein